MVNKFRIMVSIMMEVGKYGNWINIGCICCFMDNVCVGLNGISIDVSDYEEWDWGCKFW